MTCSIKTLLWIYQFNSVPPRKYVKSGTIELIALCRYISQTHLETWRRMHGNRRNWWGHKMPGRSLRWLELLRWGYLRMQKKRSVNLDSKMQFKVKMTRRWQTVELTNENEGHRNDECEDIAPDWLIVLAVSFGKEMQDLVDVVFTQCLRKDREKSFMYIYIHLYIKIKENVLSNWPGRLWERWRGKPGPMKVWLRTFQQWWGDQTQIPWSSPEPGVKRVSETNQKGSFRGAEESSKGRLPGCCWSSQICTSPPRRKRNHSQAHRQLPTNHYTPFQQ